MKKKIRNLGIVIALVGIAIVLVQCGNKDETKYSTLTGTVTLGDGSIAGGAIVILSKAANAADIVARTVTDSAGAYSIMGLQDGSYFLSARYEPSNNNNLLKSASTVILTGPEQEVSVSGDTKSDLVLSEMAPSGNAVIEVAEGEWGYDDTHSMTEFQFPFDAVDAVFTGHFSRTGLDVLHFDEANPANTHIKAWVDLTSVETGAPSYPGGHGRDGITGCIASTFKIQKDPADTVNNYTSDGTVVTNWPDETLEDYDLWGGGAATTYQKQKSIVGNSGVATFESTDVKAYGTGYVAQGNLTFAGATKSVTLYFNYLEGYSKDSDTQTTDYCSFYGFFKIAAAADFGISSSHVGSNDVTVKLSIQLNKVTAK